MVTLSKSLFTVTYKRNIIFPVKTLASDWFLSQVSAGKGILCSGDRFFKASQLAHEDVSKCKKDAPTQWMHCRGSKWFYVTQSKERMYKATHDSFMDRDGWPKRNSVKILPLKIPPLKNFIELHCTFLLFKFLNYLFMILKTNNIFFYSTVKSWKVKQIIEDDLSFH